MSYGSYSWTFEDLNVLNDASAEGEPKLVDIEFLLVCTDPGCPPSGLFGPPEYYDPGEGATWEIESIQIIMENCPPLGVTETQLSNLFPNGNDMINNAIESAAENGTIDSEKGAYYD